MAKQKMRRGIRAVQAHVPSITYRWLDWLVKSFETFTIPRSGNSHQPEKSQPSDMSQ
jgi:hypothetical protein